MLFCPVRADVARNDKVHLLLDRKMEHWFHHLASTVGLGLRAAS